MNKKTLSPLTHSAIDAVNSGQPNKYIGNGNIINALDQTPLIALIRHGNSEWVQIALNAGADPNLPNIWRDDNMKIYPLTIAFEEGCPIIVNLLLNAGASTKMVDLDNLLSQAIWPAYSFECVKIAVSLGAKITREHVQKITWRYRRFKPTNDENNASLIQIWRFLYQKSPNIVNFEIGIHNWDNRDMTFEEWLKKPELEDQGTLQSFDKSLISDSSDKPLLSGSSSKYTVVQVATLD